MSDRETTAVIALTVAIAVLVVAVWGTDSPFRPVIGGLIALAIVGAASEVILRLRKR